MNPAKTDFLTPQSSFLAGSGSVLNLAGNYFSYNTSPTEEEADALALRQDWLVTGQDIRYAMEKANQTIQPARS